MPKLRDLGIYASLAGLVVHCGGTVVITNSNAVDDAGDVQVSRAPPGEVLPPADDGAGPPLDVGIPDHAVVPMACQPRASRSCSCAPGEQGLQFCRADGTDFSACLGCRDGPKCDGDGLVVYPNGLVAYCGGYNCTASGICLMTCSSDADCDHFLYACESGKCICTQQDCQPS